MSEHEIRDHPPLRLRSRRWMLLPDLRPPTMEELRWSSRQRDRARGRVVPVPAREVEPAQPDWTVPAQRQVADEPMVAAPPETLVEDAGPEAGYAPGVVSVVVLDEHEPAHVSRFRRHHRPEPPPEIVEAIVGPDLSVEDGLSSVAAAPSAPVPLYWRLLRLRHIRPNGWLRALFFEGAVALAVVLALAGVASVWTVVVLPFVVALLVKANDVVAGGIERAARLRAATAWSDVVERE
jgi:hypothetical protein